MKAVHIQTQGVTDENESALVEAVLRFADGVKDVASVRSMNLLSVLYDERKADANQILRMVRKAGFRAKRYELHT